MNESVTISLKKYEGMKKEIRKLSQRNRDIEIEAEYLRELLRGTIDDMCAKDIKLDGDIDKHTESLISLYNTLYPAYQHNEKREDAALSEWYARHGHINDALSKAAREVVA